MNTTNEFSFLLKPSTISGAGVGVFASHNIEVGTRLEILPFDYKSRRLKKEEIPEEFLGYCIAEEDNWYRCPNEFNRMYIAWYLNHSKTPNAKGTPEGYIATKDIKKGEGILINYNELNEPEDKKEDFYKKL